MRPALCEEGLRLGRILAELAPTEPEVHGLVALMEIQASRTKARVGHSGEPVLLPRSKPRAMGSTPDPSRSGSTPPRRRIGRRQRPICCTGGNRRLSRTGTCSGRYGMATHCGALLHACSTRTLSRRGTESSGGSGNGVWSKSQPRDCRLAASQNRHSRTTTCCLACGATYSRSSAALARLALNSSSRLRSRAMFASVICSSSEQRSAQAVSADPGVM